MDEATQIIKNQLEQIPDEVSSYVTNGDWADLLDSLLVKYNIEEYKKVAIENEVLLVLINLEPWRDFQTNIEREAEIDSNTAKLITEEIIKNIFQINSVTQSPQPEAKPQPPQQPKPQNSIGSSFEQAIVNQARAMQPAREAPSNLPTSEQSERKIHDYKQGEDPYREPLEN